MEYTMGIMGTVSHWREYDAPHPLHTLLISSSNPILNPVHRSRVQIMAHFY